MGEYSEVGESLLRRACPSAATFYESGHHGDLWMDLEVLFVDVHALQGWSAALAVQLAPCRADLVCGPLTGERCWHCPWRGRWARLRLQRACCGR